jgi:hypothetical protein
MSYYNIKKWSGTIITIGAAVIAFLVMIDIIDKNVVIPLVTFTLLGGILLGDTASHSVAR